MLLHRHHIHHLANENSLFHLAKRGVGLPSYISHPPCSSPGEKDSSGPNCLTRRLMTSSATGPREKDLSETSSYRSPVAELERVIGNKCNHYYGCALRRNQICCSDTSVKIRSVCKQTGVYAAYAPHGDAVCRQRGRRRAINSRATPKLFSLAFCSSLSGSLPCNWH